MSNLWYYAKAGTTEKVGPIATEEFHRLIANGQITGRDLVWTDGMSEWAPLSSLPQLARLRQEAASKVGALPPPVPSGLLGWMTFVGVMHVVFGIMSILSCFGLLQGILLVICGTALLGARSALQAETPDWSVFILKLRTFIQVTGVLFILMITGLVFGLTFFFHRFSQLLAQVLQLAP